MEAQRCSEQTLNKFHHFSTQKLSLYDYALNVYTQFSNSQLISKSLLLRHQQIQILVIFLRRSNLSVSLFFIIGLCYCSLLRTIWGKVSKFLPSQTLPLLLLLLLILLILNLLLPQTHPIDPTPFSTLLSYRKR